MLEKVLEKWCARDFQGKTKSLDYSQEASKIKAFQLGAGGRGRTGTVSLPLDFEFYQLFVIVRFSNSL